MRVLYWSSESQLFNRIVDDLAEHLEMLEFDDISEASDLIDEEEVDFLLLDYDEDKKIIDKSLKKIKKSTDVKIFLHSNDLSQKELLKHQRSKSSGDLYLRSPLEKSLLYSLISPFVSEDIDFTTDELDEDTSPTKVLSEDEKLMLGAVLDQHAASDLNSSEEAFAISKKLDGIFESIFPITEEEKGKKEVENEAKSEDISLAQELLLDSTLEEYDLEDGQESELELTVQDETNLEDDNENSDKQETDQDDDLLLVEDLDIKEVNSMSTDETTDDLLLGEDELLVDSDLGDSGEDLLLLDDVGGGDDKAPEVGIIPEDEDLLFDITDSDSEADINSAGEADLLELAEDEDLLIEDSSSIVNTEGEGLEEIDLSSDFEDVSVSIEDGGGDSNPIDSAEELEFGEIDLSIDAEDISLSTVDGDGLNSSDSEKGLDFGEIDLSAESADELSLSTGQDEEGEGLLTQNSGDFDSIDLEGDLQSNQDFNISGDSEDNRGEDVEVAVDQSLEFDVGEIEDLSGESLEIDQTLEPEKTDSAIDLGLNLDSGLDSTLETEKDDGFLTSKEPVPDSSTIDKDTSLIQQHLTSKSETTEQLSVLGATIKTLREDREDLLLKIEELENSKNLEMKDHLSMRAELDEKSIEIDVMKRRYEKKLDQLKVELDISLDKKSLLEKKTKIYEQEIEKLNNKVRIDLNKVKLRERELENKLEMLRSDSESQIRNRDLKILELKRKIDTLEFDLESIQSQGQKMVSNKFELEEKMEKVIETLRGAIGDLEEDGVYTRKIKNIKKSLDV